MRTIVLLCLTILVAGCTGAHLTELSRYCVRGHTSVGLIAPLVGAMHDAVPSAYPLVGALRGAHTATHESESVLTARGGVDGYGATYASTSLCREDETTYQW